MSDKNIFEIATRSKIRVDTGSQVVTVEDLWDVPLTSQRNGSLDKAWKILNKAIKDCGEESFMNSSAVPAHLTVAKAVVEHIITVRKEENTAKLEKQRNAEAVAKLEEALNQKRQEALVAGSVEELEKRLAEAKANL